MQVLTHLEALRASFKASIQGQRSYAALEILLFIAIFVLFNILPLPRTIFPFFLLACTSLWFRGMSWREVGLRRPENPYITILAGMLIACGAFVLGLMVVLPLVAGPAGEGGGVAPLAFLRGNLPGFLILLAFTWPLAAFLEELVYRGYLLNRLEDALGAGKLGLFSSVFFSAALFALAHGNYSAPFLTTSFLMGLIQGCAYLAWRRNLWMPILIHGTANTLSFVAAFLGVI